MMKKMLVMIVAAAICGVANAAASYGYSVFSATSPYSLDTDPCTEHGVRYSHYVMKQEDAQAAMKTSATVTYQTMAAWLGENFADNSKSVIANAEQVSCNGYGEGGIYSFYKPGQQHGSSLDNAIGVFFYNDGKNLAYSVAANVESTFFNFENTSTSTTSGWQMAEVPEPTSGLLMLLGVAGLALKRKRA